MSAPELHLDEEGYALPAPGEDSLGIKGGRINLIGTLCLEGNLERLEYSLIEGSCRSGEVKEYVDALAEQAQRMDKACVVVLDNAPFHTSGMIQEREEEWAAKGLRLYRLPAYCPHLNLIESIWHTLKGFLLPRRFYDSVGELKQAVLHALSLLGAVEVQCSLGGT